MAKPGAKPKYDRAAFVPRICEQLLTGKPMALICRELGIPVRTVNQWRADDGEIAAEFDEAFDAGKDAIAWRMRMTARGRGEDRGGESSGDVDRDKLIIYTDQKLLSQWDKRYGERVTLAGDKDNPLTGMTDEQVDARLAALLAKRSA